MINDPRRLPHNELHRRQVHDLIIHQGSFLTDAVSTLERGRAKVALIVNSKGSLIGTITDGDIRRALIRGQVLTDPALTAANQNFFWLHEDATDREFLSLMSEKGLQQIPVLDSRKRPQALVVLEDILRRDFLPNTALLMAGGQGKRLHPVTRDTPKPMLRIGGRPMLEFVLEQCVHSGFHKFLISVGHLKEQIMDYFQDGSQFGVSIDYLVEEEPLGTVGSIALIRERLNDPLLIMNGDILSKVDISELMHFHNSRHLDATLCIKEHQYQLPFGEVTIQDDRLSGLVEKPIYSHYVSAGVCVLSESVVNSKNVPKALDLPELLLSLIGEGGVGVFPVYEAWTDIGSPRALREAQMEWG